MSIYRLKWEGDWESQQNSIAQYFSLWFGVPIWCCEEICGQHCCGKCFRSIWYGWVYTNVIGVIMDHKRDVTAVPMYEKYFTKKKFISKMRQLTVGCSFQIKWKNGSTEWVALKYLKETKPVDVFEYATACWIEKDPAFAWWVPYTLRKCDVIVPMVSLQVRKCSHKYGIDSPKAIAHTKRLDENNCNTYWTDATTKEMTNIGIAFTLLEEG